MPPYPQAPTNGNRGANAGSNAEFLASSGIERYPGSRPHQVVPHFKVLPAAAIAQRDARSQLASKAHNEVQWLREWLRFSLSHSLLARAAVNVILVKRLRFAYHFFEPTEDWKHWNEA